MRIQIYDATLTEGTREAGVQLSVRDKLRIALRLAEMGVSFIEGGWPDHGAGAELFRSARRLALGGARLCACASLGDARKASREPELAAALQSGAPAVTLRTPLAGRGEGSHAASHLESCVREVRRAGRTSLVELLDYFDALRAGKAVERMVEAAVAAGAEAVLLSDASGGSLPHEFEAGVVLARRAGRGAAIGVRARGDAGVEVANSLAAVRKGATIVATTVNGYGERCGAADLVSVAAALELKMGHQALEAGQLRRLTSLARFVAELADTEERRDQPYAGRDAFAGTAEDVRPHVDPEAVGNRAEPAMADERGHPGALRVARMLGLPARGESEARRVLSRLAAWERRGFRFEGAEASFELMLRSVAGRRRSYFRVLGYRVVDVQHEGRAFTEATVEVEVGGERIHSAAMGVGPVNALDRALHAALGPRYPELADLRVVQSRTRNLSSRVGSAGPVRVVLESADGRDHFGTAGVSDNFLQAVCQALADAAEYRLAKDDVAPKGRKRRA